MEHVDNNMDDLFRKAGELYPLKTTESDWDAVLGKIQEEISGETGSLPGLQAQGNRNKTRWLFLLLLLPASLFSLVYFSGSEIKKKTAPSTKTAKGHESSSGRSLENNPAGVAEQSIPLADHKTEALTEAGIPTSHPVSSLKSGPPEQFTQTQNHPAAAASHTKQDMILIGAVSLADVGKKSESNYTLSSTSAESFHEPAEKALPLSVYSSMESPSVYGMPFPPLASSAILLLPTKAGAGSASKTKSDKSGSSKGFYAVLLGGPDMSTVAFQSTKQMGYSLGLLLGYRFNKRLSIESGLLWDKKYYYSSGEYFNKSKTNIPNFVNILDLNGNCNMFEIPLNLRYDFATRNSHGFFITAGLSSYLMKKENYTYHASVDYAPYPVYDTTYSRTYNKASNYILSVVQLSAGYEFAIGEKTKVRIEPYLKIPLQGIGTGSMPISSAGLFLGISRSFR